MNKNREKALEGLTRIAQVIVSDKYHDESNEVLMFFSSGGINASSSFSFLLSSYSEIGSIPKYIFSSKRFGIKPMVHQK
jgi:hypothetical protein